MNYSFETVKELFDEYELVKDGKGTIMAARRGSKIPYTDAGFVAMVKFATTWVRATEFQRSRQTTDLQVITEDDYKYAFSDQAKEVYDCIMANAGQTMAAGGRLMRQETLRTEVIRNNLYKYAPTIVDGLYSNSKYLQAFDTWVRNASGIPIITEERNKGMHR